MDIITSFLFLTLNIYHEARGEPDHGKLAVGYVTLNRAKKRNLSVKNVVLQPFQFSWTIDKNYWEVYELDSFLDCVRIAKEVLETEDFTGGATHYHLDTIYPNWAPHFKYVSQYGAHKFYK